MRLKRKEENGYLLDSDPLSLESTATCLVSQKLGLTTAERVCWSGRNGIFRGGWRNRPCFSLLKMAVCRGGYESCSPREPSYARKPYVENDHFESKNRSRVLEKKKVVKQVYVVKKEIRNNISSDLNSISEKPIDVLKNSAIDSKQRGKLAIDSPSAKSEQSKLKDPNIKKVVVHPKLKYNRDAYPVHQFGKRRNSRNLVSKS